jgi:hypothetical protein
MKELNGGGGGDGAQIHHENVVHKSAAEELSAQSSFMHILRFYFDRIMTGLLLLLLLQLLQLTLTKNW